MKLLQIICNNTPWIQAKYNNKKYLWNVLKINKYEMWSYSLDKQTNKQICDCIVFLEYVHCLCVFYYESAQIYIVQCFLQNKSLNLIQDNSIYTLLYGKQQNTTVYILLIQ